MRKKEEFGAQIRHGKTGNAIVFSKQKVDNLIKMRSERRIKVSEIDSPPVTNKCEGSEGSHNGQEAIEAHHSPRDSTLGEGSEGSEGSIEGPSTSIELYHGNEENSIEVFPSFWSQITHSYSKYSTNINSQSSIIQAIIVGHKTGGASIMPSLPSLPSPTDNNRYLPTNTSYPVHVDSSNLEPKEEKIKFTPDYKAGEPIFWHVFKELANENSGLVSYDKLQERLISTGRLDAGGSVLMIEHMIKTGKIEQTENYHVYRIKMPAAIKEEEWDNTR